MRRKRERRVTVSRKRHKPASPKPRKPQRSPYEARGPIDCGKSLRIGRDAPPRGRETSPIADARLHAVKLLAPPQDRRDVGLCRLGKPISRHAELTAGRRGKVVESGVQVFVLNFSKVAAIERRDAMPDRKAQLVELKRFPGAPLFSAPIASRIASLALRYSPAFSISSINASCSGVRLIFRVGIGLISSAGSNNAYAENCQNRTP